MPDQAKAALTETTTGPSDTYVRTATCRPARSCDRKARLGQAFEDTLALAASLKVIVRRIDDGLRNRFRLHHRRGFDNITHDCAV